MASNGMGGAGSADLEARRRLLHFLRGLSELDSALGPWRPDYGGLPARSLPDPQADVDVTSAHRLYANGLAFFADNPEAAWSLGEPSRDDIAAAIADARYRFGSVVVPLQDLLGPEESGAEPESDAAGAEPPAPPGSPLPVPGPPPERSAEGLVASPAPRSDGVPAPPNNGAPAPRNNGGPTPPAPTQRNAGQPAPPSSASPGEPPEWRQPPPSRDERTVERPPRSGLAVWIGVAALLVTALIVAVVLIGTHLLLGTGPTAAAGATQPQATLPSGAITGGPLPDVMAAAEACGSIPSGQPPASLAISSTASGIGSDPGTGFGTPYVSASLAAPVSSTTPAFSLVIAVLPYGATAPGSGSPIDRAGTVQLIAYWSGSHWYAAMRSWSGSAWTAAANGAGSGVDVTHSGATVTVYWQGLTTGDKYGAVIAAAAGCSLSGLSSALSPTQSYMDALPSASATS